MSKRLKQSSDMVMEDKRGAGFQKTHALIIILIAVLAVVGVVLWLLLRPEASPNNRVVSEANIDSIEADIQKKIDEGMFNARMNTSWTFENSHSVSKNAYVANSELNSHAVYFDIILDDTGKTIFTSPKMDVGTKLENLTLDTDLAAGTYSATVLYHLLNEDDSESSSVGIAVTLHILH